MKQHLSLEVEDKISEYRKKIGGTNEQFATREDKEGNLHRIDPLGSQEMKVKGAVVKDTDIDSDHKMVQVSLNTEEQSGQHIPRKIKRRMAWKQKTEREVQEGLEFESTKQRYQELMKDVKVQCKSDIENREELTSAVNEWTENLESELKLIFKEVEIREYKAWGGKEMRAATIAKRRLRSLLHWYHGNKQQGQGGANTGGIKERNRLIALVDGCKWRQTIGVELRRRPDRMAKESMINWIMESLGKISQAKKKIVAKLQKGLLKKRIDRFRNSAKTNTKAFYRAMLGKGQKEEINGLLDIQDGEMYYDNDNKARILKREWEKIYKSEVTEMKIDPKWISEGLKQAGSWEKMDITMLDKILDTLAANKAPGEDGITNEVLKGMNKGMKDQVIMIMNKCKEMGQIPDRWKVSSITLLQKDKDKSHIPTEYRPISLLDTLYKIYTTWLYWELREHVRDKNILSDVQMGGKEGLGTADVIFSIMGMMEDAREFNKPLFLFATDIVKAFDSIEHQKE